MGPDQAAATSEDARRDRRRRRIRTAAIGALAVIAVTIGDLVISSARLPDPPAYECDPGGPPGCNDERNAAFVERIDEANEIEDELRTRTLVAALGLTAIGLMYAGFTVRREPDDPAAWAEASRDLGTAAVAWLALGGLLLYLTGGELISLPETVVLIPSLVLIPVAAIGAIGSRRMLEEDEGEPSEAWPRAAAETAAEAPPGVQAPARIAAVARLAANTGVGLAAVALLLAALGIGLLDGGCYVRREADADAVLWASFGAGIAAIALGLVALLGRLWVRALLCILLPPATYLSAYVASGCVG